VPAGLTWAPNGNLLVTLSTNNTLSVIDTATNTVVRQIPVGNVPSVVTVINGKAYVSNQGGRPAPPGDQTDSSYGTGIVTNGNSDTVPSTGTVSEVDLGTGQQVKNFTVGVEPSAMLASGTDLIITNTNNDTVSVIDTAQQRVCQTFDVNPVPGNPYGRQPNALEMLDPTHLAVSLGRDNAIAVYDCHGAYQQAGFEGLIPTGRVPAARRGQGTEPPCRASEQGLGSVGPYGTVKEGVGTCPATGKLLYNYVGTVQLVATPSPDEMCDLFTITPDFRRYNAVANQIPLPEINPGSTPAGGAPPAEPMCPSSKRKRTNRTK
jgi:YVTN family beta-propeller protein